MSPSRHPVALTPAAGLGAWACLVVALNVTTHPFVSGGAFLGLAVLAIRTGHARLVLMSVLVGAGLLFMLPGLALTSGGLGLSFAPDTPAIDVGSPGGLLYALLAASRVPAQVLACVLLALVPAPALLAALGRLSPRSALAAGMAARLRPLLVRDVRLTRDELRARGLRFDRRAPLRARLASLGALWEAMVGGVFDRAFDTAAALRARGHGAPRPTTGALRHPALASVGEPGRNLSRAVLALAGLLVVAVVAGRAAGVFATPWIRVLAGVEEVPSIAAAGVGALAALVGLVPSLGSRLGASRAVTRGRGAARTIGQPSGAYERAGARADAKVSSRVVTGHPGEVTIRSLDVSLPGRPHPVLSVADTSLAAGSLVGVVGASGSGKSTLLSAIAGTASGVPEGAVRFAGSPIATMAPADRLGVVGSVFQDPERQSVLDHVAEEVAQAARNAGMRVPDIEQRVLGTLQELGCEGLGRRRCGELSGGELQIVMLAAALVTRPAVLVLDEPTSQLDDQAAAAFWAAVEQARRTRGTTVVVAEHRLTDLLRRADRLLVLDGGRLTYDGPAAALPDHVDLAAHASLSPPGGAGHAPLGASASPALTVRGLALRSRAADGGHQQLLVRELDADMRSGTITAVTGTNGSGKSTLLRCLAGLDAPASGAVWLADGRPVVPGATAYVSQYAGSAFAADTVIDELRRRPEAARLPEHVLRAQLAGAGLADRHTSHPRELSCGERQRLAILASTTCAPPVWLLDEPTRGMDRLARRWLALRVAAHAAAGGTVVLATHDHDFVAALCSHSIAITRHGATWQSLADARARSVAPPVSAATTAPGGNGP